MKIKARYRRSINPRYLKVQAWCLHAISVKRSTQYLGLDSKMCVLHALHTENQYC